MSIVIRKRYTYNSSRRRLERKTALEEIVRAYFQLAFVRKSWGQPSIHREIRSVPQEPVARADSDRQNGYLRKRMLHFNQHEEKRQSTSRKKTARSCSVRIDVQSKQGEQRILSLSFSYDRGTILRTGRTLRDLRVNESKGIEAEKGRKRGRKRAENGRWFTQSSELTRHQKLPKRSSDKWPTYSARMLREAVSNDCLAPLAADLKVHTNKCR